MVEKSFSKQQKVDLIFSALKSTFQNIIDVREIVFKPKMLSSDELSQMAVSATSTIMYVIKDGK